jgi:hypothetical protein
MTNAQSASVVSIVAGVALYFYCRKTPAPAEKIHA